MRGAFLGGVVGCAVGAAALWLVVGGSPSRPDESAEEIHALRRDIARLSAAVAERDAHARGVSAAAPESAMQRVATDPATARNVQAGAEPSSTNPRGAPEEGAAPSNPWALDAALSVIDEAESTGGRWNQDDVERFRARMHELSVDEYVAAT